MITREYPGKILLLGEYSLLFGSKGLVLPYFEVSGAWKKNDKLLYPDKDLLLFYQHSHKTQTDLKFNWNLFHNDLENGLVFESTIPNGAGLGSSGALIAAFYDRYGLNNPAVINYGVDLNIVRENLAVLESFHHHKSSGIDPLVSWLQRPLLLNGLNKISILNELNTEIQWMRNNNFKVFLVPTNRQRQTSVWVEKFRHLLESKPFSSWLEKTYVPLVNTTTDSLLDRNKDFFEYIFELCSEQNKFMTMFLQDPKIEEIFHKYKNYKIGIKLCGAGGGGHFLLFAQDLPKEIELEMQETLKMSTVV